MKTVSTAYKDAMKKLFRNASSVRIVLNLIDTEAVSDGTWSDNGHASYAYLEMLNRESATVPAIATLELNRWELDGSQKIYTNSSVENGFVSSSLSDEDGEFSTSPAITKTFSVIHSLSGVSLYFDKSVGEWPASVTIQFYLNNALVDTLTITDIKDSFYTVWHKVDEYDKVVITSGDTLPYRRFRLSTFLFGVTEIFENDVVISTQQSHDVDPLSRRLPAETLTFTIIDFDHKYDPDNPEGFYALVEENCPVSISFGYELDDESIEWVKPDRYLLNSRPKVESERVTFEAIGLLGTMNGMYYKSQPGTKTLYAMAEDILTEANLGLTIYGTQPWDIDNSLSSMQTTAILPIDSFRNNLQRIAHAACCRLYTDDDNIIHIAPFANSIIGLYSGSTTDNGHTTYSEWDSVGTGQNQASTYATLELNRWVLDEYSPQLILPGDSDQYVDTGYVSSAVSGADGQFSTAPKITRTFQKSCNCVSVYIRFDALMEDWPDSITLKYYKGATLLATKTVTGITTPEINVICDDASDCDKIEIYGDSALPSRRLRISRIYYYASDFFLDFTTIKEKTQMVTKIDKLKSVTVKQYMYTLADSSTTLYEESIDDTELHVEFSQPAQNVSITVTGGTLSTSHIYGRAVDMTLSSGTKTVKIVGKTLTESDSSYTSSVNATGEEDIEENALVTSAALRNALMTQASAYLQMRNTYDLEYRGNPELEVGDVIGMQTRYTDNVPVLILTDEISFNGSLHGKLKVKGLI